MPKREKDSRYLKITVVLLQRHVAALDHLAVTIRLHAGVALSRASIIDAIIEASLVRPRLAVEEMLQSRVPESKDRTYMNRPARKSRRR
jgi:hypothetical protein